MKHIIDLIDSKTEFNPILIKHSEIHNNNNNRLPTATTIQMEWSSGLIWEQKKRSKVSD